MQWIAPSEKDSATATLEKNLWDAADQFRANSGLKSQEYSSPVLGLIFLRFAELRFAAQHKKLEKAGSSSRRGSRVDEPDAYHASGSGRHHLHLARHSWPLYSRIASTRIIDFEIEVGRAPTPTPKATWLSSPLSPYSPSSAGRPSGLFDGAGAAGVVRRAESSPRFGPLSMPTVRRFTPLQSCDRM